MHCRRMLSVLAIPLLLPSVVAAQVVVSPSVSGSLGNYSYAYRIDNPTSFSILLFSIAVTGSVGTVVAPTGWLSSIGVSSPGETVVGWISTDAPYDVAPFSTLSGFAFTSVDGPGRADFLTFDENFSEANGQTIGSVVSTVPEPRSLALVGTGLIALLGSMRISHRVRRRR